MYKIDKNIPMSDKMNRMSEFTRTLRNLEIGDSFLVTDKKPTQLATAIRKTKVVTKREFSWRAQENGIRIWRTA